MLTAVRITLFICALVGCQAKVEVNAGPNPDPPKPDAPKAPDEKNTAIPLEFKPPFPEDWTGVKPGEAVRLLGTCKGLKNGAIEIVAADRSFGERPAHAAADISAAFTADAKAAEAKYKDRLFTVEGVCIVVTRGALRMSGSKRAAAPAGEKPQPKDAEPVARFEAEAVLTKKADLVPHTGKVVEIIGQVHTLSLGTCKGAIVGLGRFDEKGQQDYPLIQCRVVEQEPWRRLSYDQTVTIRGKVDNGGGISNLSECVIVKEAPATAIKVTAAELAREYKKDKKATDDKYRRQPGAYTGKSLIISGEVLGWGKKGDSKFIELKGADGVTVCCYPAPGAVHFPEFEAPAGARVELVTRYGTFGTDDKVWTNVALIRVLK